MSIPKLAAFDVDGTLLDEAGVCRPRTRAALDRLRGHGVVVAIATGRPHAIADETLALVGGADFIICGNGTSLFDIESHVFLHDTYLPDDVVGPLVAEIRLRVPGTGFALELATTMVAEHGFARRVPESSQTAPVSDVLHSAADPLTGVRRVIAFHDDHDHDLAGLAGTVEPLVDERCRVDFGGLPIIDIAPAGGHKATALEALTRHLGIGRSDVLAFGDGGNDIEMIRWAGTGVAMGNAAGHVREVADHVTERHDGGGVASFLEPMLDALPPGDVAYG